MGKRKSKSPPRNAAPASRSRTKPTAAPAKRTKSSKQTKPAKRTKLVKLLSGGNPQIAKGDGDAPVQAYIGAMPGWKSELGRRLDGVVTRAVPGVQKAVKWNSPFYGIAGQGWFVGLHCFTKYVKLAFFRGTQLRPMPPGKSKQPDVRYLDLREDDALDEAQLADWAKQAAALAGWKP